MNLSKQISLVVATGFSLCFLNVDVSQSQGLASPIAPQTSQSSLSLLTLQQAIDTALANNQTVIQAKIRAERAHAAIGEATGQGMPQVRVSGTDTYSSDKTTGTGAASVSQVTPTGSIPIINDSAYGTTSVTSTSSLSGGTLTSATSTTTTGSGSSTASSSSSGGSGTSPVQPYSPSGGSSASSAVQSEQSESRSADSESAHQTTSDTGQTFTTSNTLLRHNNYSASGSITQIVDLFGLVNANNNVARRTADFYDLEERRVENETVLTVKDTYFGILKAQSAVATAQEQLNNAQAVLNDAQIRESAGTSPHFDVISAQTQVSSAQASLITAQNSLNVQLDNLNNQLDQPLGTQFRLENPTQVQIDPKTDVGQQINTAYANRPEILQAQINIEIAAGLAKLSRAGLLPAVGLTGAISYSPYVLSGTAHDSESISATISVPLYDGGQTDSRIKTSRLDETTQRSVYDQLQQNVALEVKTAIVNLIDAQALVTANQTSVDENHESVRLANIRYRSGVGTLLEVTNAEANLATAESNLSNAIYQEQTSYASLQRAVGSR